MDEPVRMLPRAAAWLTSPVPEALSPTGNTGGGTTALSPAPLAPVVALHVVDNDTNTAVPLVFGLPPPLLYGPNTLGYTVTGVLSMDRPIPATLVTGEWDLQLVASAQAIRWTPASMSAVSKGPLLPVGATATLAPPVPLTLASSSSTSSPSPLPVPLAPPRDSLLTESYFAGTHPLSLHRPSLLAYT